MPLSLSGLSDAFRGLTTIGISPPSAQSARKSLLALPRTSSDEASRPSRSGIGTSTAISVLDIVGEVSKAVGGVPYLEAIANIVISLIKIREEVEANKKRCQELLDRVLRGIERIINHLITLKRYGGHCDLGQLEHEMRKYYNFLSDVLETVTKLQNRQRYQRILDKGTDDLERLDRIMRDFDSNLIMDIVIKIMENLTNQALNSGGGEIISTHFPPTPIRILEREEQHRKSPLTLPHTTSYAASHPNRSGVGTSTAVSVLDIVGEVSKAVGGVPYLEAIANIVNSLIKIREEVEANKKRCQELLDRALRGIERIFNHLLTLDRCGGHCDLGQLEHEMRKYYNFLSDVLETVTKLQNRQRYQRILNKGTDDLERLDRVMRDFDSNLIMDIVIKIMENSTNQALNSGGGEIIPTHFPPTPIHILRSGVGTSTAISVLDIVGEVSKAVGGVPFVEAIANIVISLIKIREEVEANKKRCQELLDRALRGIERIFNHLLTLDRCGGHCDLGQLEHEMRKYYNFLSDVLETVTKLQNRQRYQRILNKGTDDLERLDQVMRDFDSNLIMDIVIKIMENSTNQALNSGGGEIISMHFPPTPICIIEREEQHHEIVSRLLSTPDTRVALLGMGGIGKTTLACSIARDPAIIKVYPRRLFLSFEGCSTSGLAYTNMAVAFNVPLDQRTSFRRIMAQVMKLLSQEKTLFVIDNFETWWEVPGNCHSAEDFLGQLASLQELAMVVTVRGIQNPASTMIDWFGTRPLPTLTQDASMDLLSVFTWNKFTNSNMKYVQKLLDAVAGNPLAVTLIGALLRDGSESPHSLWNRWDQESTRAISIAGDKLDISLRLLIFGPRMSENAKKVLAAISVLPTGLSMDDDELNKLQALLPGNIRLRDCIRTLQNDALVTLDSSNSPNRLRMLPLVRDFCLNNLPLDSKVARRLIDRYIANLRKHWDWGSSDDSTWVITELSNLTAVVHHAITLRYVTDDFGKVISRYNTWKRYLFMPETDIVERAIPILSEHPKAQAQCLQILGDMLANLSREQEAVQRLEQALSIHRELGVKIQEGWDLYLLGGAHYRLGDYPKAEHCLNEAKDLFIESGSRWNQGFVLNRLVEVYLRQDKLLQAECAAEEALELSRVSGDRKGRISALRMRGLVYRAQEKYDLAIEKLEASRDASQVMHSTQQEALANEDLGHTYRDAGQPDQAATHFRTAIQLYERAKQPTSAENVRFALEKLGMPFDISQ